MVLHFLEAYTDMSGYQLLFDSGKLKENIKIKPASKEFHIQGLLDKIESLWCFEAIKIASPNTAGQLFRCGEIRGCACQYPLLKALDLSTVVCPERSDLAWRVIARPIGLENTHFNIAALVLHDVVKIAKLALRDFLDVIKPMIDGNHDIYWLEEQRKTSDDPMLYMKAADWMAAHYLYDVYEGKRCVEEKFLDKLWRSVEIKSAPPRPYEIEIVHFH
ncbi:hypothetical protein Ddc_22213 [Ditylenchus destructor]|nr:hypothetical protein Ddc_22213 [Ditylenchus destructor]